jgi:hypothetical protein
MTDKWLNACLDLVKGTFTVFGRTWDDHTENLYTGAIRPLSDKTVWRAVTSLVYCVADFPPAPAAILLACAKWESPSPTEDDAWSFLHSQCGLVHPRPCPHPLVKQAISDIGGMNTAWHQLKHAVPPTPISVMRSQFMASYLRRQFAWYERVQQEIRKPEDFRDPQFFPCDAGTSFNSLLGGGRENGGRAPQRAEVTWVLQPVAPVDDLAQVADIRAFRCKWNARVDVMLGLAHEEEC